MFAMVRKIDSLSPKRTYEFEFVKIYKNRNVHFQEASLQ